MITHAEMLVRAIMRMHEIPSSMQAAGLYDETRLDLARPEYITDLAKLARCTSFANVFTCTMQEIKRVLLSQFNVGAYTRISKLGGDASQQGSRASHVLEPRYVACVLEQPNVNSRLITELYDYLDIFATSTNDVHVFDCYGISCDRPATCVVAEASKLFIVNVLSMAFSISSQRLTCSPTHMHGVDLSSVNSPPAAGSVRLTPLHLAAVVVETITAIDSDVFMGVLYVLMGMSSSVFTDLRSGPMLELVTDILDKISSDHRKCFSESPVMTDFRAAKTESEKPAVLLALEKYFHDTVITLLFCDFPYLVHANNFPKLKALLNGTNAFVFRPTKTYIHTIGRFEMHSGGWPGCPAPTVAPNSSIPPARGAEAWTDTADSELRPHQRIHCVDSRSLRHAQFGKSNSTVATDWIEIEKPDKKFVLEAVLSQLRDGDVARAHQILGYIGVVLPCVTSYFNALFPRCASMQISSIAEFARARSDAMHHMPRNGVDPSKMWLTLALVAMGYFKKMVERSLGARSSGQWTGMGVVCTLFAELYKRDNSLSFNGCDLQRTLFIPYTSDTGSVFTPRLLAEIDNNASEIADEYVACYASIEQKFSCAGRRGSFNGVPTASPRAASASTSTLSQASRGSQGFQGDDDDDDEEYTPQQYSLSLNLPPQKRQTSSSSSSSSKNPKSG